MTSSSVIVIGSGPAGLGAAEAFRMHQPDAEIRILTADDRSPYERPPLSKEFLRSETDSEIDDVELHPRQWFDDHAIELILEAPVTEIDTARRVVTAAGEPHGYDALILATGSSPTPLDVPGGEHALPLRSLSDAIRLRESVGSAASAVVVGAGFIGCEAAASLAIRGLGVTLVAPDDVPQEKRLGLDAGRRIRALVEATGATYRGGVGVASIDGDGRTVRLDDGTTITADVVLAATGVSPNSAVAQQAGLRVEDGRIVVDADGSTGVEGVYAAGDVSKTFNDGAGRALVIEHWQDAADQGEVAGAAAAGGRARWSAVPGFWTEIGDAALKYHAWGDGWEDSRLVERDGGFTVWYSSAGRTVGVLTLDADDDYDRGEALIINGGPVPTNR